MTAFVERVLRPGHSDPRDVRQDWFWLIGFALVLIATGLGLRDPWPADEPRFALIASDMLLSGEWLIPQVGADIYADKPPLFFWLIAICTQLTHSLRFGFLLPSVLAGIGCVLLIYDLGRRLWNRETGLIAGIALLLSVQFVWQMRQAQIDSVLCFWTTLGVYGLLRHCLLGPAWRWYAIGWAASGLGIITKGVGFLPLLILIPFAAMRRGQWTPRIVFAQAWRWWLGLLALLVAVSIWLAPMLWAAAQGDPQLLAYRNEILFNQTVNRYAAAWHHREPFWYFLVEVIPVLWLPVTVLIPWLWSKWRDAFRARDLRVVLPLIWVVLVVLFFSLSSGKRGVYVLPALPILVLAAAPFLKELATRRGPQRTLFAIACLIAGVCLAGALFLLANHGERQKLTDQYEIDALDQLLTIGVFGLIAAFVTRPSRGFVAYGVTLTFVLLVVSFWVNPVMNDVRSGAGFMHQVEQRADSFAPGRELGFVAYKEQYLLYLTRPIVNFGHARWREADQEANDAAAWMAQDPSRVLLVDETVRQQCFAMAEAQSVDTANRSAWSLVTGGANPDCVKKGQLSAARTYTRGVGLRAMDRH
jgi:4-amino-4-deoxy-L-arabinose transferase-like glycosyltransferase